MNTQLNIKTRRRPFSPNVVTLLALVVVVLVLGGPSAQAQTTTTTTTAASPPVVDSSTTIAAKGTVSDPNGTITVSGSVVINSRRVIDTTFGTPPIVVLDIDFSQLTGTSGTVKTLKTYVTGDNHAAEIRPFQASDTVIVTCPYFDSTTDGLSARTMLVTATLNFNTNTGKVTGGSITIGNNVVTSAAVSTFTVM